MKKVNLIVDVAGQAIARGRSQTDDGQPAAVKVLDDLRILVCVAMTEIMRLVDERDLRFEVFEHCPIKTRRAQFA